MREFWDERARENAAYFVDNRLDYSSPEMEAFWAEGPQIVDDCLGRAGAPAIEPHHDVVEIGCGIGRLTRPLAERARSVRALDVSAEMLRRAREALPDAHNVEWVHGDGVSLAGIADASADVVFSHVVFQHIPDPQVTLGYVREMGRVLRPGGWSAFQFSNDPSIHRPDRSLRRIVERVRGRAPRGQTNPAWLGSAVDLDELRATADAAGMDTERVIGAGTQFCMVLLRLRAGA
jgi:SAM-dependent methyltransferase